MAAKKEPAVTPQSAGVEWSREWVPALTIAAALSALYAIVVYLSGGSVTVYGWFPVIAVLLLLVSSLDLALAAMVISLFVNFFVVSFNSAVWSAVVFGVAFLLRFREFTWREITTPLTIPLLVYCACILPSFLNASDPWKSLTMLLHIAAFLVVMHGLAAGVRTHDGLRGVAALYLACALANSMHVVVQSLSGIPRPFGFAGLMFVDLSAFSVCISVTMAVVTRGAQRRALLLLSLVLTIGLVLTQTRNTWISAIITLCVLATYLIRHPGIVGLTRRRMMALTLAGSLMIAGTAGIMGILNPRIQERAFEFTHAKSVGIDESGRVENSLGTRLMIWHTAFNAFRAHPLIGIGVYAFPYSSHMYYTIPRLFYEAYVEGLTPHQSHLMVLAETGLLGFAGFMFFVVSALRQAFRFISNAANERGRRYGLVAAVAVVYCTVSMAFTDAWLWGNLIVLLAMVFGSMLANQRINAGIDHGTIVPAR